MGNSLPMLILTAEDGEDAEDPEGAKGPKKNRVGWRLAPPTVHSRAKRGLRTANHSLSTAEHAKTECPATEVSENAEKGLRRPVHAGFQSKQKDSHTKPRRSHQ